MRDRECIRHQRLASEGWDRSTHSVPTTPPPKLAEEEDSQSSRASWSSTGSPTEVLPDIGLLRLDSEWRTFLSHWNHPMLRSEVADCIPSIVAIMWSDEFLHLAGKEDLPTNLLAGLGVEDENAARQTGRLIHSILARTKITGAAMLLALFFVHRYRETPRAPIGRPGSQYRLFLVGMLLAHKYTEDHPFSNRVWAHLAGMHVINVNCMEREFLCQVDHRLGVRLRDFQQWVIALDRRFQWTATIKEHCVLPPLASDYRLMPLPPPPRYSHTALHAAAAGNVHQPQLAIPPAAKTRDRDPWPRPAVSQAASRRDSSSQGPMFSL